MKVKIENNILDSVELEGITQEKLDSMSNHELKEFQKKEIEGNIERVKKRLEFCVVSTLFFLACAIMLYINPIITIHIAIVPIVISLVFAILTIYFNENLKTKKIFQKMMELFFEENDL